MTTSMFSGGPCPSLPFYCHSGQEQQHNSGVDRACGNARQGPAAKRLSLSTSAVLIVPAAPVVESLE